MEVDGPDIFKYVVVILGSEPGLVAGLVEKPDAEGAPSNLANIWSYVLTPDISNILRNQPAGVGGEIQLAEAIHTRLKTILLKLLNLMGFALIAAVWTAI